MKPGELDVEWVPTILEVFLCECERVRVGYLRVNWMIGARLILVL